MMETEKQLDTDGNIERNAQDAPDAGQIELQLQTHIVNDSVELHRHIPSQKLPNDRIAVHRSTLDMLQPQMENGRKLTRASQSENVNNSNWSFS